MPTFKTIILTAALPVLALGQAAHSEPQDDGKLSEGRIELQDQSKPGKAGKTFFAATIIGAPMAKICATLQDFASYPSYMPNTTKTTASRLPDETSLVDITLGLPMGKIIQYRLKMTPKLDEKSCQLAWKLVPWEGLKPEETLNETIGHWDLSPTPENPNKTVVKYYVYTETGPIPLGFGWIAESMSKNSIPKMLEALRGRVRQ